MRKINLGNGKIAFVYDSLKACEILKKKLCASEFERYVKKYGFYTEPSDADVIDIMKDDVFRNYLEDAKFIDIVDEVKRYKMGAIFRVSRKSIAGKTDYTLVRTRDPYKGKGFYIWGLINPFTGDSWNGSYMTGDRDYLEEKELEAVTGTVQPLENFTKNRIR